MGVVYASRDRLLDREVALKVLHLNDASESGRSLFLREARSAASLNHPGIITIY